MRRFLIQDEGTLINFTPRARCSYGETHSRLAVKGREPGIRRRTDHDKKFSLSMGNDVFELISLAFCCADFQILYFITPSEFRISALNTLFVKLEYAAFLRDSFSRIKLHTTCFRLFYFTHVEKISKVTIVEQERYATD